MPSVEPTHSFLDKLQPSPQKKLLALDGGGIRGVIALEVLFAIEQIVRKKLDRPDAVLADYFDYMAGTSTGAVIATALALGMSVEDLRSFYIDSGPAMFSRAAVLRRFHYKFDREKLAAKFHEVFGADTTLGSSRLRTLLMMVMRNATTDSPWPICNHPGAKFNDLNLPGCNLRIPLWQLVCASTAAPTYFPPEVVRIGEEEFLFVDGGVTMFNNPAFQLFLMATVEPYKLKWPSGAERMLLVSIGTGASPRANPHLRAQDMNLIYDVSSIPVALISAAVNQQDFLCRTFGDCLFGPVLDMEVGDMCATTGPAMPKLFTYVRYNCELTRYGLDELQLKDIEPANVQMLDSVDHVADLQRIGQAVAATQVRENHFSRF
jgi:hypothetical protein